MSVRVEAHIFGLIRRVSGEVPAVNTGQRKEAAKRIGTMIISQGTRKNLNPNEAVDLLDAVQRFLLPSN